MFSPLSLGAIIYPCILCSVLLRQPSILWTPVVLNTYWASLPDLIPFCVHDPRAHSLPSHSSSAVRPVSGVICILLYLDVPACTARRAPIFFALEILFILNSIPSAQLSYHYEYFPPLQITPNGYFLCCSVFLILDNTSLTTWESCLGLSLSAYNLPTQWTQEGFTSHQILYVISMTHGFLFIEWIKEHVGIQFLLWFFNRSQGIMTWFLNL